MRTILCFSGLPYGCAAGSYISRGLRVSALDVEAGDTSCAIILVFFPFWLHNFSKHSQVSSPWKHSHCASEFYLWYIFLDSMRLFRAAMCSKRSTDFLVHFTVFVQRGQYYKIWLRYAHLAYSYYNLELFLASSLFHPLCSFLSPQSVLCSVEISRTSLLSLHTFTRT